VTGRNKKDERETCLAILNEVGEHAGRGQTFPASSRRMGAALPFAVVLPAASVSDIVKVK
jgi:hypothetical protein